MQARTIRSRSSAIAQTRPAGLDPARAWLLTFPAVAMLLFVSNPAPLVALSLAFVLSAAAVLLAQRAGNAEEGFQPMVDAIRIIAPAQFAVMLWLANSLAGSLTGSVGQGVWAAVAAIPVSVGILLAALAVEIVLSVAVLFIANRSKPVGGGAVAILIAGKYAGSLGRLF